MSFNSNDLQTIEGQEKTYTKARLIAYDHIRILISRPISEMTFVHIRDSAFDTIEYMFFGTKIKSLKDFFGL